MKAKKEWPAEGNKFFVYKREITLLSNTNWTIINEENQFIIETSDDEESMNPKKRQWREEGFKNKYMKLPVNRKSHVINLYPTDPEITDTTLLYYTFPKE